jgi:periplasmic protein CpxP/Spy
MNKTNFLTIGIVLLLVLNAVTLFILFHMHFGARHDEHNGQGPENFIVEQLKLNSKQQDQFAELRREHHDSMRNIRDQQKKLHDEYFTLLKSNDPDQKKVDSLASMMGNEQKQMEIFTFNHFQKLRAICRDDQKKLFDNTIDEIARTVLHQPPGPPGPPPHE